MEVVAFCGLLLCRCVADSDQVIANQVLADKFALAIDDFGDLSVAGRVEAVDEVVEKGVKKKRSGDYSCYL